MTGSCRHFPPNYTIPIQIPSQESQTVSSAIIVIAVAKVINWNHNEGNRRKSIESEITNKEKLSFKSIWLKSSILMESEMAVSFRSSVVHNSAGALEHLKAFAIIRAAYQESVHLRRHIAELFIIVPVCFHILIFSITSQSTLRQETGSTCSETLRVGCWPSLILRLGSKRD